MHEYTTEELTLPASFQDGINTTAYTRFLNRCSRQQHISYAAFSFPFRDEDLLGTLARIAGPDGFRFYWEKPAADFGIAAGGCLHKISHSGVDRFKKTCAAIEQLKDRCLQFSGTNQKSEGIHFLGGFSFFDELDDTRWAPFSASSFILPKRTVVKNKGRFSVTITLSLQQNRTPGAIHKQLCRQLQQVQGSGHPPAFAHSQCANGNGYSGQTPLASETDRKKWEDSVFDAKRQIANGKIKKVVLARQLHVSKPQHRTPAEIVHALRTHYPKCSSFLVGINHSDTFVGCSPETLLSYNGATLSTEALAGSIARGSDEQEDIHLRDTLLNSVKNNNEHRYVVRSIEQDLNDFADDIQRNDQPDIKQLANVQHLYTPVQAQIKQGVKPLAILGSLHPTPAVGGYPREAAVRYIRKNETVSRGWFAGPVGWLNSEGSGEFTVAIRSGLISDKSATLFAGCGIVADSDPETEWQETNLKLKPMLSALNYD